LNGGNNNRRQLPPAPSHTAPNNTNKVVKHIDQRTSVEKESDLKVREPTPDYDTQSMASIMATDGNYRSDTAVKHEGRRNSADSNPGSNGKRRFDGNRSLSSNGSTKEASNSFNQPKHNNNEGNNKTNGKVDHDEKGKPFCTILSCHDTKL
jgi:hypothetical protein